MFSKPDCVIFDLDNTLYDYESCHNQAYEHLTIHISKFLNLDRHQIAKDLSISREIIKSRLSKTASSHSRLIYIREFLTRKQIALPASFAIECENLYWSKFIAHMKLFDGSSEFITQLRLRGIHLSLFTDLTSSIQLRKLAWLGLEKSFDLILTSEEVGGDKEMGFFEKYSHEYYDFSSKLIWCIGDNLYDHRFAETSLFFQKNGSGKFAKKSENHYIFSKYVDMQNLVEAFF